MIDGRFLENAEETAVHYSSEGKILVVDHEFQNVDLVSRLMTERGYDVVSALSGELALEAVVRERPDIVLMDANMPGIDGFEVCRLLKASSTTRLTPVILVAALTAAEDRVRGIDAGADDFLSKPFVVAELEARVRSLTRLKRYTDELDSAESVILSLARTIEARDPHTFGHCERLAHYATVLGADLGVSDSQQLALTRGGYLHDVGKVGIPDAILLKPGPLDPAEFLAMQR